MMSVFSNTIYIPDGFLKEDFDYLKSQLLTCRSVLSDQQKSTNLISHLFEAAKTMLTTMEYLGSADYARACILINKLHVEVETPKETNLDPAAKPSSIVCADANLPKSIIERIQKYNASNSDTVYPDTLFIRLLGVYSIRPIKEFTLRVYLCEKNSDEQILLGQDHRMGNPNMVLAYQENFPAPSVFRNLIYHEIICPGIDAFLKTMSSKHEKEMED